MTLSYDPTMSNKYKNRSGISESKIWRIIKLFVLDIEATMQGIAANRRFFLLIIQNAQWTDL